MSEVKIMKEKKEIRLYALVCFAMRSIISRCEPPTVRILFCSPHGAKHMLATRATFCLDSTLQSSRREQPSVGIPLCSLRGTKHMFTARATFYCLCIWGRVVSRLEGMACGASVVLTIYSTNPNVSYLNFTGVTHLRVNLF